MSHATLTLIVVGLLGIVVGGMAFMLLIPTTKLYHQGYMINDRMIDAPDEPFTETKRRVAEHDKSIRQLQEGSKR